VETHLKPRFEFMKKAGLAGAANIDDSTIPHAFFALSGEGPPTWKIFLPILR